MTISNHQIHLPKFQETDFKVEFRMIHDESVFGTVVLYLDFGPNTIQIFFKNCEQVFDWLTELRNNSYAFQQDCEEDLLERSSKERVIEF